MRNVLLISRFPPRSIVGFLPARGGGRANMRFSPGRGLREASRSAFLDRAEENRATGGQDHPGPRKTTALKNSIAVPRNKRKRAETSISLTGTGARYYI